MSELPISSPYRSTPEAPVTEAERAQLSERINSAYADGRIDAEDYRARLDTLYAARRLGELVPVVQGLPPAATYAEPSIVTSTGGQPGELTPARSGTQLTVLTGAGIAVGVILLVILLVLIF